MTAVRHERVTSATKPLDESVVSSFSPDVVNKLNKFSAGTFYKPEGFRGFFEAGALDLYSGKAGVAKRLIDEGAPWVLSVDILNGASQNLLDLSLQQSILRLIGMGAFKVVGSAMICQSFTGAITPCVRTTIFLRGVPWMSRNMQQKVSDGNKHYDFNKQVIDECEASSTFYWFENPDSSFVWQQVGFERYKSPKSNHRFRADFCRYGTVWRKRTRLAVSLPSLRGVRLMCQCGRSHRHEVLRGYNRRCRMAWTKLAEAYPSCGAPIVVAG